MRRAMGVRGRHSAWHRALGFGVAVSIDQCLCQGICGGTRPGGHTILGGVDFCSVVLGLVILQQEALWSAV